MHCPRCQLKLPKNTLVCVRCGEQTPRPTGLAFDTRPPERGPKLVSGLGRELPIDRRGRGVRAVGLPPPLRLRPATPTWSRGDAPEVRRRLHAVPSASAPQAMPSTVAQAKTDPLWHHPPVDERLPEVASDVDEAIDLPGSLGARLGAATIDCAIVLLAVLLAGALAAFAFGPAKLAPYARHGLDYVVDGLFIGRQLGLVVVALAAVFAGAYSTVAHALCGATFGKRVFGLRVVTTDGDRPTFADACARSVVALLGLACAGLGPAFVLVDARRLALHDRLVGTRVVRN